MSILKTFHITSYFPTKEGTLNFKWWEWSKDFVGLKFSIPGFFWVGNFGKHFLKLDLSGNFWGYSKIIIWRFAVVPANPSCLVLQIMYNTFWTFLSLGDSVWGFFGGSFCPGMSTFWKSQYLLVNFKVYLTMKRFQYSRATPHCWGDIHQPKSKIQEMLPQDHAGSQIESYLNFEQLRAKTIFSWKVLISFHSWMLL